MSKLYRARSLLYRRQILQVTTRWKALDEIYKIYMLLHRSDLNISKIKIRQNVSHFLANFATFRFELFSLFFAPILMKFCWNFADNLEKNLMLKISEIFEFSYFSNEKFRKIPILKEFEWFEWFEMVRNGSNGSVPRRSNLSTLGSAAWSARRSAAARLS